MRYINSRWSSAIVVLLILASTCFSQTETDVVELQVGKPIERELAGGSVHVYSVRLQAGQLLKAVVDQRGIDVVIKVFGPDDKLLIGVDSPNGNQGPEPISFIAQTSGTYKLNVHSGEEKAPKGRYEVRVEVLRTATALEKSDFEAKELARILASAETDEERAILLEQRRELVTVQLLRGLYEHARDFRNQRKFSQALAISRFGLGLAEQLGDKTGRGDFFYNIGYVLFWQADHSQALEYVQRSLALREELGEKSKAGDAATVIALTYIRQNEPVKALDSYRRALGFYEGARDQVFVARTQSNMGQLLRDQGNYNEALETFQKSAQTFEALNDKSAIGNVMLDIGFTFELQAKTTPALEYRQKALALGEELGNKRLMAQALLNLGWFYRRQNKLIPALEYFQKELEIREKIGSKTEIARALSNIGFIYGEQDKYVLAIDFGNRSLLLSETTGDKDVMAFALRTIGQAYQRQGKRLEAMEYFKKSLKLSEEVKDNGSMAGALSQIGNLYLVWGKYPEALEHLQRALRLNQQLKNRAGIAGSLNQIGNVQYLLGNYSEALKYLQESLRLHEQVGDRTGMAFNLYTLAKVYNSKGDYSEALEYGERAFKLRNESGQKMAVADSLNTIGVTHYQMKNYALALKYIQKSLSIMEEIGVKRGIAIGLSNIGELHAAEGNYEQALDFYRKSLALLEVLGDQSLIASSLSSIGYTYFLKSDYDQALEYLSKSLVLSEKLGDKLQTTDTLNKTGLVHERQGNYPKALECAQVSANIARQIGSREQLWEALTISGNSLQKLNQPAQARPAFEEAIATIESIRSNIGGAESRASFFAAVQRPYELYTHLLMQMHKQHPSAGHNALALEVNERSRARSLLEALSEARADIRQGVDPELLQRERTLQERLNAAAERQTRLLTDRHTEEEVAKIKKEIDALTLEFQDVEGQIRQRSPRYAALTQPSPLNLREIQTKVLDADTLLLEYALGEEKSYLWAITPTSINSFELPKRSEIEADVRRAVGLLTDGKRWTTNAKLRMEYAEFAGRLSEMLLGPVVGQLKGKRLLVVGDGALQYLPFGALPSPSESVTERSGRSSRRARLSRGSTSNVRYPLTVELEIVSLPSASTLAILRRETANRTSPAKSVAVLADPVFERDDERLRPAATRIAGSQLPKPRLESSSPVDNRYLLERAFGLGLSPVVSGGEVREILRIPRLPFTRREAAAILAAAPGSEGMQALDFKASRATAMNPELAQYRIVHFATHGLLNSEHPELSGIVLSLLNETGEPIDGFLRLHEIYNLNLPADLVVLSACQTGLGKEIRGEGLVGLTRGFMYAGSPRVVASLWKVDDAATAELMKRFYSAMLKDNLRPAAALRRAKIEMWKQKRWEAPFYWAAFELQGEWR